MIDEPERLVILSAQWIGFWRDLKPSYREYSPYNFEHKTAMRTRGAAKDVRHSRWIRQKILDILASGAKAGH